MTTSLMSCDETYSPSSDVTGGAGAWHQSQMKEAMNRDDVRSELFGSQNEAARVGYWELLYDLARARPVISINSRWTCNRLALTRIFFGLTPYFEPQISLRRPLILNKILKNFNQNL